MHTTNYKKQRRATNGNHHRQSNNNNTDINNSYRQKLEIDSCKTPNA